MRIEFDELRDFLDRVLQELEDSGYSEFELDEGYYWEVLDDDRYELYDGPPEPAVGDLDHDVERIRQVLNGEYSPHKINLVWLGNLLRSIGERGDET